MPCPVENLYLRSARHLNETRREAEALAPPARDRKRHENEKHSRALWAPGSTRGGTGSPEKLFGGNRGVVLFFLTEAAEKCILP